METSLGFRHKHYLPTRLTHAPPRLINRRPLLHGHGDRTVRRADLSMRRTCAHLCFAICNRGYGGRTSILACLVRNNPIATSSDRSLGLKASADKGLRREEEEAEEKKKKPSARALAPPEVPAPGDCCGSGCVRCVWDVYYEELEAFNNSLRRDEGTGSESNPS